MRGKTSLPPRLSLVTAANELGQLPQILLPISSITPLQRSPSPPVLPSLPLPPSAAGPLCVPPKHSGDPRDPTSRMTPSTHGEDILSKAKCLFRRRRGGPFSGITVSHRIKEASKIAALNYILADEHHANNGRCKHSLHEAPWHEWSYSSQQGWGPRCGVPMGACAWAEGVATCSAQACVAVGTPQRWPEQPRLGPVTMGTPGSWCSLLSDSERLVLLQPRSCQALRPM